MIELFWTVFTIALAIGSAGLLLFVLWCWISIWMMKISYRKMKKDLEALDEEFERAARELGRAGGRRSGASN